ncbi:MAG: AfsR/SARP family transcriptional regulator, partial [Hamadaea sp.]|nr:AfsR/SARP family transcriptional regulator [Hamadaea sp.]
RLPAQLTSFVGRERELDRIATLLAGARLVTLTGPGGAGKTRLAVEAGSATGGDVCFIDLSAVTAGADVASALVGGLGLRDAGLRATGPRPPDAADRLTAALTGRDLLLVLDNCEHVVEDAARTTARLLRDCPGVRILATSREPLGITGEALCPVTGLGSDTADAPAVRLFADRAADVQPGYAVTDADRADVARICAALDGLPLAIELAAARLRSLPVAEIAARLDDRFRLLSRGSRGAQPRHQTLRAVVEWSWELLDDHERALARRLSVFAGDAGLAAVESVCGGPDVPDVLEVLSGLVDKSLVESAGGRYRMLETIRAFCAGRLDAAGEAEATARAHAAYFLALAEQVEPHLRTADQLHWLTALDADRDNLHAALRWTIAAGPTETGMRLVASLAFYWWLRGLRTEAASYAARLCDAAGHTPPPDLIEEHALCELVAALGDSRSHPPMHGDQVRELLYGLRKPPRQPFLLFLTALSSGPPAQTPPDIAEMGEAWADVLGDDPWSLAIGGIGVGMTWFLHGDLDRADAGIRAGLDGFRPLGERWGTILALSGAAEVAGRRGDHAAAVAHFAEALHLAEELESEVDLADLHAGRGDAHQRAGDLVAADADYAAAVEHGRRAGAPELLSRAYLGQANVARTRGDLDTARRHCLTALAECPIGWFSAEAVRLSTLVTLGRIDEAAGDPAAAAARYREAITSAAVWSPDELGWAVEGLARLALDGGDPLRAAYLMGVAEACGGLDGLPDRQELGAAVRDRAGHSAYHEGFAEGMTHGREKGAAAAL